VPVRYKKTKEPIDGVYPLVVWEKQDRPDSRRQGTERCPENLLRYSEYQVIGDHVFSTASYNGTDFLRISGSVIRRTVELASQRLDQVRIEPRQEHLRKALHHVRNRGVPRCAGPGARALRGRQLERERMAARELVDAPCLFLGEAARAEHPEGLLRVERTQFHLAKPCRPSPVRRPPGARPAAAGDQRHDRRRQGGQQRLPKPRVRQGRTPRSCPNAMSRGFHHPKGAATAPRCRLRFGIHGDHRRDCGKDAVRRRLDVAAIEPQLQVLPRQRLDDRAQQRRLSYSAGAVDEGRPRMGGSGTCTAPATERTFALAADECPARGFRQAIGEYACHGRLLSGRVAKLTPSASVPVWSNPTSSIGAPGPRGITGSRVAEA